jgi:hypothetical protein
MMISQTSTVDKTVSLDSAVSELRSFLLDALHNGLTFHDFEQGVHQRVLQIGHAATSDFLTAQGSGDLGPSLTLPNGDTVRRLQDLHTRELTCLFGTFTLERSVYGTREGQKIEFVPLDSRLALPPGKFSFLLEDFNQLFATENPFAKVATTLERLLCLKQHVDSLERQNRSLGADVEAFRKAQPVPAAKEEKEILVRTADCKGVPMRRPADAPAINNHEHKPGPKKDRKKMAVVGSVYTVDPHVRTAEEIVEALFRDPGSEKPDRDRPEPKHKRVIARMNEYQSEEGEQRDGLVDVFLWLGQQVNERNPLRDKRIVNLMDGEHRLWDIKDLLPGRCLQVDVLDLLHVTPRLWTAAGLFAVTASAKAQKLVRKWLLQVLRGQVGEVMKDMRAKGEKALSKKKQAELEKVCGYLENNKKRMKYDEYLKAGYPIASGVIEGACRHYVKDRMERTGMSWVQAGAQPMLELRSTNLNGDWDAFMAFHRERQTTLFHPHRSLLEQVAWPLAV